MKAMIKGWALVSVLTMLLSLAGVAYGEELPVIDDDDTTYWLDEVEGTVILDDPIYFMGLEEETEEELPETGNPTTEPTTAHAEAYRRTHLRTHAEAYRRTHHGTDAAAYGRTNHRTDAATHGRTNNRANTAAYGSAYY